jgi:hypothetical protein
MPFLFLFMSRRPTHVTPALTPSGLARRTGLVIAGLWIWLGVLDALFVFFHLTDRLWLATTALTVPIALVSGVLFFRLGRVVEQLDSSSSRGEAPLQADAQSTAFGSEIGAGARAGVLGGLGFGLHNAAGFLVATLGFSIAAPLDSLLVLIFHLGAGVAVGVFVGVVLSAWGAWTSQPAGAARMASQSNWPAPPGRTASSVGTDPARSNPGWSGYSGADNSGTEGRRRS